MRGHNICFYSEIRKIIFELSSVPVKVKTSHEVYANDAGKVICMSHWEIHICANWQYKCANFIIPVF